jgi:carbamoyl-phosphate synthase large subunit
MYSTTQVEIEMILNDIKVIVTAAGCPDASKFIKMLEDRVSERKITIIATDMQAEPIGRFLAEKYYKIPAASDPGYIESLIYIIEKENPDVLFCVSSSEVPVVAANFEKLESLGTKVIVSPLSAITVTENKYQLHVLLRDNDHVSVPSYFYPQNLEEFIESAHKLGYPDKRVCFKPHALKGSRRFRILDDSISRKDLLLNYKPESLFMSMYEFISIFEKEPSFPDFIVMEYAEGKEIDAMVLSYEGETLLVTRKTREKSRAGVVMQGELVERPGIVKAYQEIIRAVPLLQELIRTVLFLHFHEA